MRDVSPRSDVPGDAALRTALLQIHLCVLLWGLTAILGKLITLQPVALVWWRVVIVMAALSLVPRFWRGLRETPPATIGVFAAIGAIVVLHWVTFYGAIKLANASVAVSCLGLGPAFAAVIEPAVTGRRFDSRELLLGLGVLPGVWLVVGGTPVSMQPGIVVGSFSAALIAVFGSLNKRFVNRADPLVVTGLELGAGGLLLSLLIAVSDRDWASLTWPGPRDAALLVMLALGCTLLPFALSLVALRRLTAYSTQLALNLEPIYAIVLAIVLLGEQRELGLSFYAGVAIILSAVVAHPLLGARARRNRYASKPGQLS
jgi:drug/metabolite transporter (DMT)-like permease